MKLIKYLTILIVFSFTSCNEIVEDKGNIKKTTYKKLPIPKIEFNPRNYICYKSEENLVIDGKLDEQAWKNAKWTENFIDIEGVVEPKFKTRAKMLWDNNYFYVAAELIEPHVSASLIKRDTIIYFDNDFEVFIDPEGDTHNYFEFEMNALNTVWDLLMVKPYRDGAPAVVAWDIAGLKSAVDIQGTINNPNDTDEKWIVEIAFPIEILCEKKIKRPKHKDIWRVNFSRVEWQYEVIEGEYKKKINPETGNVFPENNWVWSPQGVINMHYPEMWGFVQFSGNSPGSEQETFVLKEEELIKWELRQIYYYQKTHIYKYKKYAQNLKDLSEFGLKLNEKYQYSSEITNTLFKISIITQTQTWNINNKGKVWETIVLKKGL